MQGPRRKIIGGNWKMNTTLPGAIDLARGIASRLTDIKGIDVVVFPPFPNLRPVRHALQRSEIALGAQDVFWESRGAFTGEVSAPMLRAVGCRWVIAGHSERRRILGESSAIVNRKLVAALHAGLRVILAIGETAEERHGGHIERVLHEQLHESLETVPADQMAKVVIAYEPVWAIGTGETATPDQARDAHACVRGILAELYGEETAASIRILYGGSVTPENAAQLMQEPGIDGALVGGASLNPDDFARIVLAAAGR